MFLIFSDLFFQKFQLFNFDGLSALYLILYLFLLGYFVSGKLIIDLKALSLTMPFILSVTVSYLISDFAKPASLFLLYITYLPFIFGLFANKLDYLVVVRYFLKFMIVIWFFGVLQITLSIFYGEAFDPIYNFLSQLGCCFLQGYMTPYEAIYGSGIYKPNGFFLLEPSFYSQYMALALIGEIIFFKRFIYMAIFSSGLLMAMSGTGILLVFFFVLISLFRLEYFKYIFISILFFLVLYMSFGELIESIFLKRLSEFSIEGSSAFLRFVGPYLAMYDVTHGVKDFLFGHGSGSVDFIEENLLSYEADFSGFSKLFLEYGLLGSFSFTLLFGYFILNSYSVRFSLSVLFMILFLSGGLLQIHTVLLFFGLVGLYKVRNV